MLKQNSKEYSAYLASTLPNLDLIRPFYGVLYLTTPAWTFNNYGFWVQVINKEKFSLYGSLEKTTFAHNTLYNAGLRENYPYPLFTSYPIGQDLIAKNKIRINSIAVGVKGEVKINKFLNSELNLIYCKIPGPNAQIWGSHYSTAIISRLAEQEEEIDFDLYYANVNPKGFLLAKAGLNCKLSNKFKLHLLYTRTISEILKYKQGKQGVPYRYRQNYQGLPFR